MITVPMVRSQGPRSPPACTASQGKPPDYFMVTEKPPSYEEALLMLPPFPATCSRSLELNTEGGLAGSLVPHQVPESQAEGATGGSLTQSTTWVGGGAGHHQEVQGPATGRVSSPPSYSSQLSLCAFQVTTESNYVSSPPPPPDEATLILDTGVTTETEEGEQNVSSLVCLDDSDTVEQIQITPESQEKLTKHESTVTVAESAVDT